MIRDWEHDDDVGERDAYFQSLQVVIFSRILPLNLLPCHLCLVMRLYNKTNWLCIVFQAQYLILVLKYIIGHHRRIQWCLTL